jgi:hypothetical protein
MFIYSLETFLFKNLNRKDNKNDDNKFLWLGPFALVLGVITFIA